MSVLVNKQKLASPIERLSVSTTQAGPFEEVKMKKGNKVKEEIKHELFKLKQTDSGKGSNEVEKSHEDLFDRIQQETTTEMLSLVKHLKQNAETLGQIAREDQTLIGTIMNQMEVQLGRFEKVNATLKDLTKRYGSMCLLQLCAILTVLIVFIMMFMFIRIFPKRRYSTFNYAKPDVSSHDVPESIIEKVATETINTIISTTSTAMKQVNISPTLVNEEL